ncbi:MAG: 16S rRNA (guanine(966)-N(2))-methyltransferase RsmD [Clostridia bacterium]|nr:16S rRNA (guanine(966)-N(2))-methyltransferase RsmD [Clostridia bacterium]
MRVITGIARGKRLLSPEGYDIRPTSDKVKESVFSAIQFDIEGAKVLDLFAGSGQLGIEALSRGAQSAVFVDKSNSAINVVKQNIAATGFADKSTVISADYTTFLARNNTKFDIAFLDPPYQLGILKDALEKTALTMSNSGIIVCEHPLDVVLDEEIGQFSLYRKYKYSKICVSLFRVKELD